MPQDRQKPFHQWTPEELKARAEASFKRREQQKLDAPLAMREYREAERTTLDRMMKLRAERLARRG